MNRGPCAAARYWLPGQEPVFNLKPNGMLLGGLNYPDSSFHRHNLVEQRAYGLSKQAMVNFPDCLGPVIVGTGYECRQSSATDVI